jgi:hypothetical protein
MTPAPLDTNREGCQRLLGISFPTEFAKPVGRGCVCEICGTLTPRVMSCGHLDTQDVILACPECRRSEAYQKLYEKRFGGLAEER